MTRIVAFVLAILSILSLGSCGIGDSKLSGKYVSESGSETIEFKRDGTCSMVSEGYISDQFYEGTYKKTDSGWRVQLHDEYNLISMTYTVERDGRDLILSNRFTSVRFVKR